MAKGLEEWNTIASTQGTNLKMSKLIFNGVPS
jgi:hypothetical protein